MFESREGKELKKGMLVGLHFNAKRKDFSVVDMKSTKTPNKVIGYITKGRIKNGYTLIGKSGQKEVRESKQKNRHAFLVGYWDGHELNSLDNVDGQVYYNPHIVDSFIDYDLFFDNEVVRKIDSTEYFQVDLMEVDGEIKPLVTYQF